MKNKNEYLPDLSKPEYDILKILWNEGKKSAREIHENIKKTHDWAITTTRTVIDRMVKEGLLKREVKNGIFTFEPLVTRPAGLAKFVQFFSERILETDTNNVVLMISNTTEITNKELDELRNILKKEKESCF